jgi:uncharacterized protein YdaU (DUF1376 family)
MANQIRWYKRDPTAALEGMAMLTLQERGAYNTLLDLIYCHDGSIDDDPDLLCFWLKCDRRVWKRLRATLIEKRKLYVHGNKLRNSRADREVEVARDKIAAATIAGLASAAKRAAEAKILKGLASTPVERPFQLPTPTPKKSLSYAEPALYGNAEGPPMKRPHDVSRGELEAIIVAKRSH